MPEHPPPADAASPVTLITGAGSGIGRATASLLAGARHRLVLAGRRRETLEETTSMLGTGAEALIVCADVAEAAQAAEMVDAAVERYGRLDNLVNNAGLAPVRPIDQTTPEVLRAVYGVNALGPAYAIVRAWPTFVRQRSGCIVNVSTMGTVDPFPGFFAYAAAKSAVNSMARSCAKEGRAFNIRAFAVAPGAVETEILRANFPESVLPRDKALDPRAVARVIVDCIAGALDDQNGGTVLVPSP